MNQHLSPFFFYPIIPVSGDAGIRALSPPLSSSYSRFDMGLWRPPPSCCGFTLSGSPTCVVRVRSSLLRAPDSCGGESGPAPAAVRDGRILPYHSPGTADITSRRQHSWRLLLASTSWTGVRGGQRLQGVLGARLRGDAPPHHRPPV